MAVLFKKPAVCADAVVHPRGDPDLEGGCGRRRKCLLSAANASWQEVAPVETHATSQEASVIG